MLHCPRLLTILVTVTVLSVRSTHLIKSKAAKNFLKSREEVKKNIVDEWNEVNDDDSTFAATDFLGELEGPTSPRIYPPNIPKLYPDCKYVDISNHFPDKSILIDFNNGRLGNQISSLASTLSLALELDLTPMITHKTSQFLKKYFQDQLVVDILESRFCSPWSDLTFEKLQDKSGNTGEVLLKYYL